MKEQLKSPHVWLTAMAMAIGASLQLGLVDANAREGKALLLALMVLAGLGVGFAVKYLPPPLRAMLDQSVTVVPGAVVTPEAKTDEPEQPKTLP